jgi:hypothetical protein
MALLPTLQALNRNYNALWGQQYVRSTSPDPDEELCIRSASRPPVRLKHMYPPTRHLANCSTVPRIARDDRRRFRSAALSPASSLADVRQAARAASPHSFCATKTRELRV